MIKKTVALLFLFTMLMLSLVACNSPVAQATASALGNDVVVEQTAVLLQTPIRSKNSVTS